jgi:hypothetical protein
MFTIGEERRSKGHSNIVRNRVSEITINSSPLGRDISLSNIGRKPGCSAYIFFPGNLIVSLLPITGNAVGEYAIE